MTRKKNTRRQISSALKPLKWKDSVVGYWECHGQRKRLTIGYWRKQGSPQHRKWSICVDENVKLYTHSLTHSLGKRSKSRITNSYQQRSVHACAVHQSPAPRRSLPGLSRRLSDMRIHAASSFRSRPALPSPVRDSPSATRENLICVQCKLLLSKRLFVSSRRSLIADY